MCCVIFLKNATQSFIVLSCQINSNLRTCLIWSGLQRIDGLSPPTTTTQPGSREQTQVAKRIKMPKRGVNWVNSNFSCNNQILRLAQLTPCAQKSVSINLTHKGLATYVPNLLQHGNSMNVKTSIELLKVNAQSKWRERNAAMFCQGIGESPLSTSPRWSTRARVQLPLDPCKDQVLYMG